jgi:hypothetical protein
MVVYAAVPFQASLGKLEARALVAAAKTAKLYFMANYEMRY